MIKFSVVICAYTMDRWDDLRACIKSIQEQTLPALEVIVVIDHNKELFECTMSTFPELVVIENQGTRGLSDARNTGIAISKGQIIAFIDEDAVASPDWLCNLSMPYEDRNVMGVGGLVSPNWIASKPAWFPAEFNWVVGCSYRGLPEKSTVVRNMIGCNMSIRRDVFNSVEGFRSGIGRVGTIPLGCEETELCIRISQEIDDSTIVHEPSAAVLHRVPPQRGTVRYFLSRCYAEGISKALVTKLVGQTGLSSETNYTLKTLPQGVWNGIRDAIFKFDLSGLGRATAIIAGFSYTVAGYLIGRWSVNRRVLPKIANDKRSMVNNYSVAK